MVEKIIEFTVKNANLAYRKGMPMILRLAEPALHGDWKDTSRELVPVGQYEVIDVWDNCYGRWVRINHNKKHHDIEPKYFEWYREDQRPTPAPNPSFNLTKTRSKERNENENAGHRNRSFLQA